MSDKPKRLKENPFYDINKIASTTDMTGLEPAPVLDDAEADSYEELYPMHRQKPIDSD